MSAIDKALAEIAKAFGATGMHVNHGESEDYMQGYNDGYEDGYAGKSPAPERDAPTREPWRRAYLRGYDHGWTDATEIDPEDDNA